MSRKLLTREVVGSLALLCSTRTEFARKYNGAYRIARESGLLEEMCSHMPKRKARKIILTEQKIRLMASRCKNRTEFNDKYGSAYGKAIQLNILDSVCAHMPKDIRRGRKPHNFKWSKDRLKKIFDKFNSRESLREYNDGAYQAALVNGCLSELCGHMKRSRTVSQHESFLLNFIKQHYINAKKLKDCNVQLTEKPWIKGFEIDIYIPELRKGIEFDGTYWHSFEVMRKDRKKREWPDEDIKNYHKIKDGYFKSKGIPILHIKEKEWMKNRQKCLQKCIDFLNN